MDCARSKKQSGSIIARALLNAALTKPALRDQTSMRFRTFLVSLLYIVPAAVIAWGWPPHVANLAPPGMAPILGLLLLLSGAFLHLGHAVMRSRQQADSEITGAMEAVAHLERVQRRLEGDLSQM